MTVNITSPSLVKVGQHELPSTETFTYLGSIINQNGGASKNIQNRMDKARNALVSLKAVWKSTQYSTKIKLEIYPSCVLFSLLYGSECWRRTEYDMSRLSTFHTTSLRKIKRIFWPRKITNEEVLCQSN